MWDIQFPTTWGRNTKIWFGKCNLGVPGRHPSGDQFDLLGSEKKAELDA